MPRRINLLSLLLLVIHKPQKLPRKQKKQRREKYIAVTQLPFPAMTVKTQLFTKKGGVGSSKIGVRGRSCGIGCKHPNAFHVKRNEIMVLRVMTDSLTGLQFLSFRPK